MQRVAKHILDFYSRPAGMTSVGRHISEFDALPNNVGELVRTVQHLLVYDVVARDFYGFTIPAGRESEIHIRPVEEMIDRLLALEAQTLRLHRSVEKRITGRCRDFTLFLIAMLRTKGVPARARCGFGSYFNPPYFEDHWICEYWNAVEGRWVVVDPQFDEVWRGELGITHDVLDVPRDRFLVAAEAWNQCRAGGLDPDKFGVQFADIRGLWFIAGNLVRDFAALNRVEMLPWDVWGAQPRPYERLNDEQLAFFDLIADLGHNPDDSFDELCNLYQTDARLHVPSTVFNAILDRSETLQRL